MHLTKEKIILLCLFGLALFVLARLFFLKRERSGVAGADDDPPVLVQYADGNYVEGQIGDTIAVSSPVQSISIPAKMCVHLYQPDCAIGSKNCEIVECGEKTLQLNDLTLFTPGSRIQVTGVKEKDITIYDTLNMQVSALNVGETKTLSNLPYPVKKICATRSGVGALAQGSSSSGQKASVSVCSERCVENFPLLRNWSIKAEANPAQLSYCHS